MYGICLHYTNNRDQAKDILQNGFIKVFISLKHFKNEGSLEGWIRRIITHTAIDHLRKEEKHRNLIDQELEAEIAYVPEDIIDQIQTTRLLEWVNRLPEGARIIFNLHALEGYNHEEISKKLNISVGTSKSQLNRAKSLLRKWILAEAQ